MSRIAEHYLGDNYPETPGFTEPTTSRDAAVAMKKEAANLRTLVLAAIDASGPMGLTADETAEKLNLSVLSIRPRLVELGPKHFDKIKKTGVRRRNISGMAAAVWRIKGVGP